MDTVITKTFTITCNASLMKRLETFLAMLYYNGSWGHSAYMGIFMDGDGSDKIKVDPLDESAKDEIALIHGVGQDLEVANDGWCSSYKFNRDANKWLSKDGVLYKNGEEYKIKDG